MALCVAIQVVLLRQIGLIEIAPRPRLAGFDRSDQRMSCLRVVPTSMSQLRTVAATRKSTRQTHPDMNPLGPIGDTRRTFRPRRYRDFHTAQVLATASLERALENESTDTIHTPTLCTHTCAVMGAPSRFTANFRTGAIVVVEDQIQQVATAISDHRWEELGTLLSDSFFDHSPAPGEPTASARLVPLISDLGAAVPDLTVTVDNLSEKGDRASALLTLKGTHLNPLWGSPGTGNAIAWTTPIEFKLINGRLAFRFDDLAFPELVAVLRQLGLVNPPEDMDKPVAHPVVVPEFLLKVAMTGQAGDKECGHLDEIRVTEPTTRVCAQCYDEGVIWPALRMCLTCGFVGCCDTSHNKHARQHHDETGHPMMRSIHMDEGWAWCYQDNAFFEAGVISNRAE